MKLKAFKGLVWTTLIAIYLVILAGSIVRTTGSGMGCPDWPKCFGQWIPPTEISQLPDNYKEIFLEKRLTKVEKYTSFLTKIGYGDIADKINADPKVKEEEPFVPVKTWIEYINRLLGFMAGNFLILMTFLSLFLLRHNKSLFFLSFGTLLFTGFQGWFGSIVVASNLTPWTITIHMFFALLIVYMLIKIISYSYGDRINIKKSDRLFLYFAFFISLFQVYIGTQVRQEIDVVSKQLVERSDWIEQLSSVFEFHRSFAILILLVNGYLIYKLGRKFPNATRLLIAVLVFEVITGIIMAYFSVPKAAQPTHLLLSTVMFGIHSFMLCRVCLLYTSPSPRDQRGSRMPSSA